MADDHPDYARRFAGVGRLYGTQALGRFRGAHICIIGIGGVGSWAAEALARSAVGQLTLIDLDMVAESNTNRQIHALDDEYGKAKVRAMAERIRAINPSCVLHEVEDFVSPENLDQLLNQRFDFIIDAIDQVRTKAALIAWCVRHQIPVITSGGAGGQIDPGRIVLDDLARTIQDPLLAKVRSLLRRDFAFPRDPKKKFNVPAVYSKEPLRYPDGAADCETGAGAAGLSCSGFGSSICITATFGLFAAAAVLQHLATPVCPD